MIDAGAIVVESEAQLAVRCGPLLIWATAHRLEDAPLEQLRAALEAMAADAPVGVGLLMIAIGESELPKLDTRRRIVRGMSTLGDRLQAVAACFEGDKPWMSLARATIEGMFRQVESKLVGSRFPMGVFGDREDALVWLGGVMVGPDRRPIETDGLMTIIDEVCARVGG